MFAFLRPKVFFNPYHDRRGRFTTGPGGRARGAISELVAETIPGARDASRRAIGVGDTLSFESGGIKIRETVLGVKKSPFGTSIVSSVEHTRRDGSKSTSQSEVPIADFVRTAKRKQLESGTSVGPSRPAATPLSQGIGTNAGSRPTNLRELHEYARNKLGTGPGSLDHLDIGLMTQAVDHVATLKERCPSVKLNSVANRLESENYTPMRSQGFGWGKTQTIAAARKSTGELGFNPKYFGKAANFDGTIPKMGGGWSAVGSRRGTVTHEFGHLVEARMAHVDPVGLARWNVEHPAASTKVSRYAKTKSSEHFAEAFAQLALKSSDQWSPSTRALHTLLTSSGVLVS